MAPKKADLLAQATELGYDVDDSLTRKELAELVARGPAAPEGEEVEAEAPTAEIPAADEEPDADEPTLTSGGVDEQRRAMRYPTAVRMGRPRL